jgi:hypothetical protein
MATVADDTDEDSFKSIQAWENEPYRGRRQYCGMGDKGDFD